MRSVAYGLTALSPGVGQAEDFIEKKGIPDDQVPAFLAKFGDPQLAGLIAQKQRLKQIQAKMPPPGGPQAAPPTVKDDINMQVMRALNPTPNNPQPQAGQQPGQPPQGGPPPGGQPPQGGPPPGGQPPQAGGPPVQAAAGGLMGQGIGGLDAGAMEAPRHFDDGGIVAFAGGGSYKDVTDTATAQREADLQGIPMDQRWTAEKEAKWRQLEQLRNDRNEIFSRGAEVGGGASDEDTNILRLWASRSAEYNTLNTQREAALKRQQYTPKIKEGETAKKYGLPEPTSPTVAPIAPPEEEAVVEDTPVVKDTPKVSSGAPSSAAASPGLPTFDFSKTDPNTEDSLKRVEESHKGTMGAYDKLYTDVKEAKPTLLEEDTEGLKYQKETADIKLEKAKEKYADAKGYGARKKAIDKAMYDAQRGLGTTSIFWRSISAWRDAKEAAEDAKDAADLAYRDQVQAVKDARQKRIDDNTKASQDFYKAQVEKLGNITVQRESAAEHYETTVADIKDKGIKNQIDALQAETGVVNARANVTQANASMINAAATRESNENYRQERLSLQEQQTVSAESARIETALEKYRASIENQTDPKTDKLYTTDQVDTLVENERRRRINSSPILKKYLMGQNKSGYGVVGPSEK